MHTGYNVGVRGILKIVLFFDVPIRGRMAVESPTIHFRTIIEKLYILEFGSIITWTDWNIRGPSELRPAISDSGSSTILRRSGRSLKFYR